MRNVCAIQPCLLPSWRALITRSRKSTEYPLMPTSLISSPSYFSSLYLRTAVGKIIEIFLENRPDLAKELRSLISAVERARYDAEIRLAQEDFALAFFRLLRYPAYRADAKI